jgi:hypothetical protein
MRSQKRRRKHTCRVRTDERDLGKRAPYLFPHVKPKAADWVFGSFAPAHGVCEREKRPLHRNPRVVEHRCTLDQLVIVFSLGESLATLPTLAIVAEKLFHLQAVCMAAVLRQKYDTQD